MMRIDIAICDDEQKSLQMIQKELYHIADKLKIEIETYAYKEGKKVLDLIYNEKELMPCLKAAYQRLEEMQDSYMIVKTGEAEVRVKHSDIMYFETSARKIGIHLKNGEVLFVRKTIKELYEELNDEHFIKIHSGCVANAKYIGKYSNHDITLDNGEHLIVSRTRIKSVKIALMNYWGNQV